MTFWLTVVHHNTIWLQKIANKHSAKWEQICVMSVTSLTLKTPECFPFSGKIIHHTVQKEVKPCCCKSADVDWYVRVGRKSMVQVEIIILCACMLHHCKTPRQPPLKKWLQYILYLLFCHQTSIKNKVKCGYLLSWWKKYSFFSFHCEQVTILWYTLRRHHQ